MERITDRRFKRLQFFQIFRHSDLYRDTSVPGNLASLRSFRLQVIRRWLRALQRRSQKDRMTWPRLVAIAERWLPKPRILHPYPTDRGDGGNVGIIRSLLRVTVLPDCGGGRQVNRCPYRDPKVLKTLALRRRARFLGMSR